LRFRGRKAEAATVGVVPTIQAIIQSLVPSELSSPTHSLYPLHGRDKGDARRKDWVLSSDAHPHEKLLSESAVK